MYELNKTLMDFIEPHPLDKVTRKINKSEDLLDSVLKRVISTKSKYRKKAITNETKECLKEKIQKRVKKSTHFVFHSIWSL